MIPSQKSTATMPNETKGRDQGKERHREDTRQIEKGDKCNSRDESVQGQWKSMHLMICDRDRKRENPQLYDCTIGSHIIPCAFGESREFDTMSVAVGQVVRTQRR